MGLADSLDGFLREVDRARSALRTAADAGKAEGGAVADAVAAWPYLVPDWTQGLGAYDARRFGPLLGVSDEGSAAAVIAAAAAQSAKARAAGKIDPAVVGLIIDGERMTSAGEVPIGPDEYREIVPAAFGKTYCTTNVGVRANARIYQPLPEFVVPADKGKIDEVAQAVVARFEPFVKTPSGRPRPLTVRLVVRHDTPPAAVSALLDAVEAARAEGKLGDRGLHRVSLLLFFDDEIDPALDRGMIKDWLALSAKHDLPELAVDGEMLESARRRVHVQGLLNVLSVPALQAMLIEAERAGVRLTHRYALDPESAARTVWTGLHTARTFGLSAAKYGLLPMALAEQQHVVERVCEWTRGWTAVPAFYVDTPLLTDTDVFGADRCVEAATLWLKTVAAAGAKVVLIDSPDRVTPRRLITDGGVNDPGVLTIDQVAGLCEVARGLGVKALWSGGITPPQAFALARLGVDGIFTTSSTAQRIAVGAVVGRDPQLPFENEPTGPGVRRIHALIGSGFLFGVLADAALAKRVEDAAKALLAAIAASAAIDVVQGHLDILEAVLVEAWPVHWKAAEQ